MQALVRRGDPGRRRVAVRALYEDGPALEELRAEGFDALALGGRGGLSPSLAWRLAREIRRLRPALVHGHEMHAALGAAMLANPGIPWVQTEHCSFEDGPSPARAAAMWRSFAPRIARVIAVSDATGESLVARVPSLRRRLATIPNGVDLGRFVDAETPARESGRAIEGRSGGPVVGCAARLVEQKGWDLFLEVAATMIAREGEMGGSTERSGDEGIRFLVAGDGPLRGELERLASAPELRGRVRFAGEVEDVGRFLRGLDLFLMTSRHEEMPTSLLEAMACGTPALAGAIPGGVERLESRFEELRGKDDDDGVTRTPLVVARDAKTLARAALGLLADPAARAERARLGRELAAEFDMGEIARRVEDEYEAVLSGSLRRTPSRSGHSAGQRGSREPMELVIVHPGPSPHVADWFDALSRRPDARLEVLYLMDRIPGRDVWDGARKPAAAVEGDPAATSSDAPTVRFLRAVRLSRAREFSVWNPELPALLRERAARGATFLLGGGYTLPSVANAMLSLNRLRARWYFLSEAPGYDPAAWKRIPRAWIARACLARCSGVLAHSPLAIEAYARLGVERARLHFLPYYMDVDEFRAIPRPRPGSISEFDVTGPDAIGADAGPEVRFLFFGRLIPVKGPDRAMRAFARAVERSARFERAPRISLTIAGEGPMRAELEREARRLPAGAVRFAGEVEWGDRVALLANHDVLLMPSRHDGFGMVAMEALAAGMPVVASRACGAPAAFVSPDHGRIVDGDDAEETASAMLDYVDADGAALRAASVEARRAVAEWTPDAGAARLLDLLGGGGGAGGGGGSLA